MSILSSKQLRSISWLMLRSWGWAYIIYTSRLDLALFRNRAAHDTHKTTSMCNKNLACWQYRRRKYGDDRARWDEKRQTNSMVTDTKAEREKDKIMMRELIKMYFEWIGIGLCLTASGRLLSAFWASPPRHVHAGVLNNTTETMSCTRLKW